MGFKLLMMLCLELYMIEVQAIRFCVYGQGGYGLVHSSYTSLMAPRRYIVTFDTVNGGRWTQLIGRSDGSVAEGNADGCSTGGKLTVFGFHYLYYNFNWQSRRDVNYHCSIGITICNLKFEDREDRRSITGLFRCCCVHPGYASNKSTGSTDFDNNCVKYNQTAEAYAIFSTTIEKWRPERTVKTE